MNQNEEGMLGTRRRMTPQEVGMIVRMYRESNQVKRAALAAQANISEKTLERLEAGVPVQETTYRRVAIALGIADDSFIREEYIPTPEEYLHRQEAEQAEFKKTLTKVDVARLIDPRQILSVFGAHSCLADDHKVSADDLDLIAAFKENFRDWSDISSDLAETARLDAARQLLEQAQEIERAGYAVCIGLTNRYGINGVRIDMAVMVFIPHRELSKVPLPTEIWLPKRMGMGW